MIFIRFVSILFSSVPSSASRLGQQQSPTETRNSGGQITDVASMLRSAMAAASQTRDGSAADCGSEGSLIADKVSMAWATPNGRTAVDLAAGMSGQGGGSGADGGDRVDVGESDDLEGGKGKKKKRTTFAASVTQVMKDWLRDNFDVSSFPEAGLVYYVYTRTNVNDTSPEQTDR